jgi:hypothetical protein
MEMLENVGLDLPFFFFFSLYIKLDVLRLLTANSDEF